MTEQEQRKRWEDAVSRPEIIQKHLDAVRAARCKKIRCMETGMIYSSQTEFAKSVGVTIGMVNGVLRGKHGSVRGFHLEYVK